MQEKDGFLNSIDQTNWYMLRPGSRWERCFCTVFAVD